MKFLFVFLILTLIAVKVYAKVTSRIFRSSYHPQVCYIQGNIVVPGQHFHPDGVCACFICEGEDGTGQMWSCDEHKAPEGCQYSDPVKPNAEYPDCCARELICS